MVLDINALGGVQVPPCEYLSVNGDYWVDMTCLFPEHLLQFYIGDEVEAPMIMMSEIH